MIKNPLKHKQERDNQHTNDAKGRKIEVNPESSLTGSKSLKFIYLCKKSSCKTFKENTFSRSGIIYFCVQFQYKIY